MQEPFVSDSYDVIDIFPKSQILTNVPRNGMVRGELRGYGYLKVLEILKE
jgi:hypothetical protein